MANKYAERVRTKCTLCNAHEIFLHTICKYQIKYFQQEHFINSIYDMPCHAMCAICKFFLCPEMAYKICSASGQFSADIDFGNLQNMLIHANNWNEIENSFRIIEV